MLEFKDGLNGKLVYYYRNVREGDWVTRKHVACGIKALALAAADERERNERKAARRAKKVRQEAALRVYRSRYGPIDGLLAKWSDRVTAVWREFMRSQGWYYHRGEWRRRAMSKTGHGSPPAGSRSTATAGRPGDPKVKKITWLAFEANPNLVAVCGGDLAQKIVNRLLDIVAGDDSDLREAVHRHLEQVQAGLEEQSLTALERLLARRVVISWMALCEAQLACIEYEHGGTGDFSVSTAEFLERRYERRHRRFDADCRELWLAQRAGDLRGAVRTASAAPPALLPPLPRTAETSEAEGLEDRWGRAMVRARALALAGGPGSGNGHGNGHG
jgi:hypothetical protein